MIQIYTKNEGIMSSDIRKTIIACLGSSTTAARGTYNWIGELERRPKNASLRVYRFSDGGDLAYNGFRRLPNVIARHPDRIIVQLGGNDVLATIFANMEKFVRLTKHLPHEPSAGWFKENMKAIIRGLKQNTMARIAVCSHIPVGEAPESTNRIQSELNHRIADYNVITKEIVAEEGVSYLPLYERMQEIILQSPGKEFTRLKFLPFYRDVFRQYFLGKSNDQIGDLNGWYLHRDGVHLNRRSGKILADLVQDFLDT
jgi:lysophospholipase L1-like esterase